MTAKQFTDTEVSADLGWIRLYTSDEEYNDYDGDEILEMINNLHRENQFLKGYINVFCFLLNRKIDEIGYTTDEKEKAVLGFIYDVKEQLEDLE